MTYLILFATHTVLLMQSNKQLKAIPVNMPDLIRIRAGSAGKHWPAAGRMILAHWLASGPDPVWPKPGTISQS